MGAGFQTELSGNCRIFNETSKTPDSQCVYSDRHGARENDIVASLELNNPVTMVTGFDRPNLFFRVVTRKGGSQKDNSIINYVKKHEDESGIIYCATKKNVDKLYTLLNEQGISAGRYHAGLSMMNVSRIRRILHTTESV